MTATTEFSYIVQQRVNGGERWLDVKASDDLPTARRNESLIREFHVSDSELPPMIESRVIERRVTTVEEVMP